MAKGNKNNGGKKHSEKETKAVATRQTGELLPRWERELDRMSDLFDRMVDEYWRHPFPRLLRPFQRWPFRDVPLLSAPALDLYEEKNDVVVKAEIPGLTKNDVEVNLTDNILTIKGEKKGREGEGRRV